MDSIGAALRGGASAVTSGVGKIGTLTGSALGGAAKLVMLDKVYDELSMRLRDSKRMDVLLRKSLAISKEREMACRAILETKPTTTWGKLKNKGYYVMECSGSSFPAMLLNFVVMACIVISTIAFVVETLPSMQVYGPYWINLEVFVVAIFFCEYVFRFSFTPSSTLDFLFNPMNLVDVISIAPFFIELIFLLCMMAGPGEKGYDLRVLRIVRLFRLLRLLKLVRQAKSMLLVRRAIQETAEALITILAFLVICFIMFSAAIMTSERGQWAAGDGTGLRPEGCYHRAGEALCSPFESVPVGLYWAATTITSVGYGDVYPLETGGKVIASIAMTLGVIAVAFPIIVVSFHIGSRWVAVFAEMESTRPLLNTYQEEWDVHYKYEARPKFVEAQNLLYSQLEKLDDSLLAFEELRVDSQMLGSAALHMKGHTLNSSCQMTELQGEVFTLGIEKNLDAIRSFVLAEIKENFEASERLVGNEDDGDTPLPTPTSSARLSTRRGSQLQIETEANPPTDKLLHNVRAAEAEEESEAIQFIVRCRYVLFKLLDEPDSSRAAGLTMSYFCTCVFVSCASILLQTIPWMLKAYDVIWFRIEMYNTMTFTVEYVLRISVTPKDRWDFICERMNFIDLIGILPFYLEVMLYGLVALGMEYPTTAVLVLRVMRLCRLLRLFRFAKYIKVVHTVMRALQQSSDAFFLLAFFMILGLIFAGALMHSIEQGDWDEAMGCFVRPERPDLGCSPFQSIPHSFYWGVTTMTTVGYGDTYPVTPAGKVVATMTMILGLLAIALPVSMISDRFVIMVAVVEAEYEARDMREDMKVMQRNGHLSEDVHEHFDFAFEDLKEVRSKLSRILPEFEKRIATVMEEDEAASGVSNVWWRKLYNCHGGQVLSSLEFVLEEYGRAREISA